MIMCHSKSKNFRFPIFQTVPERFKNHNSPSLCGKGLPLKKSFCLAPDEYFSPARAGDFRLDSGKRSAPPHGCNHISGLLSLSVLTDSCVPSTSALQPPRLAKHFGRGPCCRGSAMSMNNHEVGPWELLTSKLDLAQIVSQAAPYSAQAQLPHLTRGVPSHRWDTLQCL